MFSIARLLLILILAAPAVLVQRAAAAAPVTFLFTLPEDARNPFSRDLWAEVTTPAGRLLQLPVYFAGDKKFGVRARAEERGVYSLGKITEKTEGGIRDVERNASGRDKQMVKLVEERPSVRLDPKDRRRFVMSDDREYTPVGANLAWPPRGELDFYRKAFSDFGREGLNWTRIWMCHWGALNLDWHSDPRRKSPAPGSLDLRVASTWDRLLANAEDRGVYVQLVLQHHGQYATSVNPNWADNPWNVANGGFLKAPGEFFTSPTARELTKLKYRYIVARWGYSPAILAWELFNEVHWVDALSKHDDVAAVAAWHAEMAEYIRSIDVYRHLVTTSTEDLGSPIYAQMDYFQPHLYAPDMIASPQRFAVNPAELSRPVFYGEVGEDHMRVTDQVKKSGLLIVPPVWAGVMGEGRYPPQPWLGAELIATKRLGELGAVARFAKAMNGKPRGQLARFSPMVESTLQVPLVLTAGQHWQRRSSPVISILTNGRYTSEVAEMPHYIVGAPESIADGFSPRVTLRIDVPQDTTARLLLADAGAKGAVLRVTIDGKFASEEKWEALAVAEGEKPPKRPREIGIPLTTGQHEIVLENIGALDWVEFDSLDFGLRVPAVAAIGKRTPDFVAVWLWRRDGVFAEETPAADKTSMVTLDDLAEGTWRVTWWDSLKGVPAKTDEVIHSGGTMRLAVPAISRHLAVILEREGL